MSINLETFPTQNSPHQPIITSPLFRPPSALNHSRFNPHHMRPQLQTHLRINSSSSGSSSAGQPKPFRLTRKARHENEPKSSTFLPNQFRSNLEARLREEMGSPQALEPESSSSQPSEPFSGTYKDFSPFQAHGEKKDSRKGQEDVFFSEQFYKRINDFLDTEGLELADPADQMQGIRLFSKASMQEESEDGCQGEEMMMYQIKGVQSANHSPKLIADNLFSSTLLQRRSSRSQGPGGALNVLSSIKKPKQGKLNVGVFRHFQDDLNQIMQTASPIEEKITPVISRNNSGFYENTPDRLGPKKFSFKHLMSPDARDKNDDSRFRNGLAKYIIKPTKSFKSPHITKIGSMMSMNSPLKSTKEENESFSFCSSPVMIIPSPSPKKASPSLQQATRPERYVKGKVVRKSRFQTLRDLEECPPKN